jgi:hypothetical protein
MYRIPKEVSKREQTHESHISSECSGHSLFSYLVTTSRDPPLILSTIYNPIEHPIRAILMR